MKKTIEILVGIPCSGKSTLVSKTLELNNWSEDKLTVALSRDDIRNYDLCFKQPYAHSNKNEQMVTEIFNSELDTWLKLPMVEKIILDNTHCKEKYINEIITKYGNEFNITIKFLDISLTRAHIRNVKRYLRTGKWIPFSVINNMYENYNKINREKYGKYISM